MDRHFHPMMIGTGQRQLPAESQPPLRAVHRTWPWLLLWPALAESLLAGCEAPKPAVLPTSAPTTQEALDEPDAGPRTRWRAPSDRARAEAKRAEESADRALAAAATASRAQTDARDSHKAGDQAAQARAAERANQYAAQARAAAAEAAHATANARQAARDAEAKAQAVSADKQAAPADVSDSTQAMEQARVAAARAAEAGDKAGQYAVLAERAARNAAEMGSEPDRPPLLPPPGTIPSGGAAEGISAASAPPPGPPALSPRRPVDANTSPTRPPVVISAKTGLPVLPVVAMPKTPSAGPTRPIPASAPAVTVPQTAPALPDSPPRPRVDLADLPSAPRLPSVHTRPAGIIVGRKGTPGPETWQGKWVQVEGGNAADFLPGGYTASYLVFRGENTVEVHRAYANATITRSWRIGCTWNAKTATLTLGADAKHRPPAMSLKGHDLKVLDSSVAVANNDLPAAFPLTRPSKDRIRLDGKTYERQPSQK